MIDVFKGNMCCIYYLHIHFILLYIKCHVLIVNHFKKNCIKTYEKKKLQLQIIDVKVTK